MWQLTIRCHDNDKAARHGAVAKLKFFWGFTSELQTNPMPFR